MKTLKEIQSLTAAAKKKQEVDEANRKQKEKQKEIQRLKEEDEDAKKIVPFIMSEIEKAAKKGKKSYDIDLGVTMSRRMGLEIKYIKEKLKEFNPTFTEVQRTGNHYDWDGGITGEYYYTAMNAAFNW